MTEKEKKTVVETSGTAQKDPRRTDAMRKT